MVRFRLFLIGEYWGITNHSYININIGVRFLKQDKPSDLRPSRLSLSSEYYLLYDTPLLIEREWACDFRGVTL